MRLILQIITSASIILSGLAPAFGISLLKYKTPAVSRWAYGFGVYYTYDNGGSSWNYEKGYQNQQTLRHDRHRHLRFIHRYERPTNEKIEGLIKHLTRHSSRRDELFPPVTLPRFYHIGR